METGGESFDDVARRAFDLYVANEPRKAIAMAKYASTIRPESEYPHRIRAISYRRLRRPKKALQAALEAIALAPREPLLHSLAADLYLDRNDLPLALKYATTATRLDPDMAQAHASKARVLLISQRYDEAEAAIDRALAIDPNAPESISTHALLVRHKRAFGMSLNHMRDAAGDLTDIEQCRSFAGLVDDFLRGGPPAQTNQAVPGIPRIGRRSLLGAAILLLHIPIMLTSAIQRRAKFRLLPPDVRAHYRTARDHPVLRRERRLLRIATVGPYFALLVAFIVFYGFIVPRSR